MWIQNKRTIQKLFHLAAALQAVVKEMEVVEQMMGHGCGDIYLYQ